MAYTLKTTGIATNLTCCLAVEDDGTTITDFKSAAITADITKDGGVTMGAETWRSAGSRKYFQTTSGAFVNFGTNKPTFGSASGNTLFIAFADATKTDGQQGRVISIAGANESIGFYDWGGGLRFRLNASQAQSTTYGFVSSPYNSEPGQLSYACASGGGTDWDLYWNGASAATLTTNAAPTSFQPTYLGRGADSSATYVAAKYFLVAQFNTRLNSTQIAALNTDWFDELFEAPAGASSIMLRANNFSSGVTLIHSEG